MSAKLKISFIIIAAFFFILALLFLNRGEIADIQPEHNPYKDANLTVEIIHAPNDTYGYNIKMNGRLIIHQPNAPALPGVEGFKTDEYARKVAKFVVEKNRQNIFPPSVSVEELDSLGVL